MLASLRVDVQVRNTGRSPMKKRDEIELEMTVKIQRLFAAQYHHEIGPLVKDLERLAHDRLREVRIEVEHVTRQVLPPDFAIVLDGDEHRLMGTKMPPHDPKHTVACECGVSFLSGRENVLLCRGETFSVRCPNCTKEHLVLRRGLAP